MSDRIARRDRMFRRGWGFLIGVMVMGIGCCAIAASPSGGKTVDRGERIGQEMKDPKKRFEGCCDSEIGQADD